MISKTKSEAKFSEADFIVGIDLGNAASSISYYDYKQGMPEILDVSGGYGKASVPTAVQYLQDSGEWICGDYALLSTDRDNSVMCTDLIKGLGNNQCFIINQGAVTLSYVLGIFIRELIGNIKNVNPNVKIRGIVASVSRELNDDAVSELMLAFKEAGYDKYVLKIASQSECMINALLYEKKAQIEKKEEMKNILLLDFSDEGLRSKAYRINRNDGINAECIYREANKQVSTKKIEDDVYKLFCELYKQDNELDNRAKDLLEGFTFEHKDLIFQKMRTGCRIYFNFAYPPIRKNLTSEMIKAVIAPMEEKINEITDNIFSRISGFDAVILSGGGFENSWSKEIIEKKYSKTIYEGKGTKRIISDGACIIAAIMLGAAESENISVREKVIQKEEIGIMTKSRDGDIFTALIESDRISASEGEEKKFILKGEESANIDFFSRNEKGDMKRIWSVTLNELPKRKKGALRIAVRLNINEKGELTAVFKDDGFGEIYPKTDYIRRFTLLMKNTIGDEMN